MNNKKFLASIVALCFVFSITAQSQSNAEQSKQSSTEKTTLDESPNSLTEAEAELKERERMKREGGSVNRAPEDIGLFSEHGGTVINGAEGKLVLSNQAESSQLRFDQSDIQRFNAVTGVYGGTLYLNDQGGDVRLADGRMLVSATGTSTLTSEGLRITHNSSGTSPHLDLFENAVDFARLRMRSNPAGTANDDKYWDVAGQTGTSVQDRFNLFYFNGSTGNNFFSIDPNLNNIVVDGDIVAGDVAFDLGNNNATEHWDDCVADDFINFSDQRLKENITSYGSVMASFMKLRPVTYKYISEHNRDGRQRSGFLAQEMKQVFPNVVVEEDVDVDPYTNELIVTKSEYLSMNYIELIPITVKAIQEQQTLIETQQDQIQSQNEEIELLKLEIEKIKDLINN